MPHGDRIYTIIGGKFLHNISIFYWSLLIPKNGISMKSKLAKLSPISNDFIRRLWIYQRTWFFTGQTIGSWEAWKKFRKSLRQSYWSDISWSNCAIFVNANRWLVNLESGQYLFISSVWSYNRTICMDTIFESIISTRSGPFSNLGSHWLVL